MHVSLYSKCITEIMLYINHWSDTYHILQCQAQLFNPEINLTDLRLISKTSFTGHKHCDAWITRWHHYLHACQSITHTHSSARKGAKASSGELMPTAAVQKKNWQKTLHVHEQNSIKPMRGEQMIKNAHLFRFFTVVRKESVCWKEQHMLQFGHFLTTLNSKISFNL